MNIPQYQCHKQVGALKISEIQNPFPGGKGNAQILHFEDPFDSVQVSAEWMSKHNPVVGGYYVVYQDGYASFSPADAFESGYTKVDEGDSQETIRT